MYGITRNEYLNIYYSQLAFGIKESHPNNSILQLVILLKMTLMLLLCVFCIQHLYVASFPLDLIPEDDKCDDVKCPELNCTDGIAIKKEGDCCRSCIKIGKDTKSIDSHWSK